MDVLGRVLGGYAPQDPIIRERGQLETPMTFAYGTDPDDAEQTASDTDSTRTARRDSLSEDAAAELLRRVDAGHDVQRVQLVHDDSADDESANPTQELRTDDEIHDELGEIVEAETLQINGDPPTLESLPEASGTLPSLPPSPESTPTLPASEAPKTPKTITVPPMAASEAPSTAPSIAPSASPSTAPSTAPSLAASAPVPSSHPTVIAPKSLGVTSRPHTDLFEDLLRAPVPQMRRLVGVTRISHGDHPPVQPIVDLESESTGLPSTRRSTASIEAVPSSSSSVFTSAPSEREAPSPTLIPSAGPSTLPGVAGGVSVAPPTTVPQTKPYPFSAFPDGADPELAPITEPASLPIPLFATTPATESGAHSAPLPLARLIETSIVSHGARPTLESAQPVAIADPPKSPSSAPSPWAHGANAQADAKNAGPVRPLVLPDMSGAVPALPTFDPRLAHVDYAEGLARRQQIEQAAANAIVQVRTMAPRSAAGSLMAIADLERPAHTARSRGSRLLLAAFAAFAILIAATLFCAAVLILQQGKQVGPMAASQPARASQLEQKPAKSAPAKAASTVATAAPPAPAARPTESSSQTSDGAKGSALAAAEDNGIPVLAVDLLPRVHNRHGILHAGKSFDGHRVFVDGAVMGNGSGDYELLCGRHSVKMGSQDRARVIVVPCGGEVSL